MEFSGPADDVGMVGIEFDSAREVIGRAVELLQEEANRTGYSVALRVVVI